MGDTGSSTSPTPSTAWDRSRRINSLELYRRRFGIETSYRQLHQVRARTSSRNPALRLLLVGLALLIVNLWVLLLRTWVQVTRYGGRVRIVELTLERIADALVDNLKQLLGVIPAFQVKAVLHAT
jgi:hypothetical protein